MTLDDKLAEDAEKLPFCASQLEIKESKLIHEVCAVLMEVHKNVMEKTLQSVPLESTSKPSSTWSNRQNDLRQPSSTSFPSPSLPQ